MHPRNRPAHVHQFVTPVASLAILVLGAILTVAFAATPAATPASTAPATASPDNAPPKPAPTTTAHRDASAVSILQALEHAAAENGWSKVKGLRFTTVVTKSGETTGEFHHLWSPADGKYRVEWASSNRSKHLVILDLKTRKGRSWIEVPPPTLKVSPAKEFIPTADKWVEGKGTTLQSEIERAYKRFLNQTYWFLAPLAMQDPKLALDHDGTTTLENEPHDVLKLTLAGAKPEDAETFWVSVNQRTHLADRWEGLNDPETDVQARTGTPKGPAGTASASAASDKKIAWDLSLWKSFGTLRLPTRKARVDEKVVVELRDVEVITTKLDDEFAAPKR